MLGIKEEAAQKFWVLSRQWRGDQRFGSINVSQMLHALADLGGTTNNIRWARLEDQVSKLLSQVINNKRSRKRKPVNNVVVLFKKAPQGLTVIESKSISQGLTGRKAELVVYDDYHTTQVG